MRKIKKILLVTDNEVLLFRFKKLIHERIVFEKAKFKVHYAYTSKNVAFYTKFFETDWIRPITIKNEVDFLIKEYDIILSLHCKQLFPEKLVKNVKCINIHPGLNPNNRGWFPQVFSIINKLPCGATIHEMDEQLDHGKIICQKEVKIEMWDTSLTAYNKIIEAEIELLSDNLENILIGQYESFLPEVGNLNLRIDFDKLCNIDLEDTDTFLNHINKLRALTHGNYANAYFIDKETNKRVYVKIELTHE